MSKKLKISVLIPTYNRHEMLVNTLKSLLMQTYQNMEIVVYDQTSSHPPEIESSLSKISHRIKLHKGEAKGLVNAYRRCMELSNGSICLFVDDDVLITDKEFVEKHARHYDTPEIGAVAGQILNESKSVLDKSSTKIKSRYGWRYVRFNIEEQIDYMPTVGASNMSFPRMLYNQVGGFDIKYEGNGFRFETDFSFAIRKAGKRIIFDPEASLVHYYGSHGGSENRFLGSISSDSSGWYIDFFANTWYFLLKWYSIPEAIILMSTIWHEHAFNRPILKAGKKLLIQRHRALLSGLNKGWNNWKTYKKEKRE